RIGGYGKALHSDVRIVCATNRDLREECRRGRFRQDLWFRLSIQVVDVPPLRRRFEDIKALLSALPIEGASSLWSPLSPEATELLRGHGWQGNFRELANFAARLPAASGEGSLGARACRQALEAGAIEAAPSAAPAPAAAAEPGDWPAMVAEAAQLAAR